MAHYGRPPDAPRQVSYAPAGQAIQNQPSTSSQLENAAQLVEDRVSVEMQPAPDLETFLRDAPTSSNYMEPPNSRWDPFVQRKTVNVPSGLLDSYGVNTRPQLGLLPEIGRAWIAVDNRLFLWDYSGSSEAGSLLTYDEETERISAVGLVAPKKAVFLDTVQHILVICTAVSVRLVGVKLEPAQGSGAPRLTMYETDRKVNTDGIAPTAVCGTPEGRIFIACEDGALREVDYRAETSWLPWQFAALASISTFSAGTQQHRSIFGRGQTSTPIHAHLTYDATRRNLYSCTSSSLEAYSLGSSANDKPHRIAALSNICAAAQAKAPNQPMLEAAAFAVVAVDVIAKDESNSVALVLTTSNCVRLYFSLGYAYGYYAGASSSQFNLLHVRLPPNPAPASSTPYFSSSQQQPPPQQQQNYVLRALRSALNAKTGLFLGANEERVWFAAPHQLPRQQQAPSVRAEVAMNMDLPGGTFAISELPQNAGRREFMALNTSLAVTYAHNRPVDTLAYLLENGDRNELAAFSNDHSPEQACAWCLALACGGAVSQEIVNAARRVYHEIGSSRQAQGTSYGPDGRPTFSPRHQGFAIHLARLLKPLWRLRVTQPALPPADPTSQDSAVPIATLIAVQKGLNGLRIFADQESNLFAPLPEQFENRPDTAILKAEQASFVGLRSLLIQATEALSFILLLIDFRLPEIVASCAPDLKQALSNLTYKDLVATHHGRDVVRKLVHVIINHRITQGESVDSVSDLLEARCGSFCSADDILVYKGSESLRLAHDAPSKAEQHRCLRDSLQLFLKASKHIDIDKLREIRAAYVEIGYFVGAVELCLSCARGALSEEVKTGAYDCVLTTLASANTALDAAVAGDGPRSVEEAEATRETAFRKALDTEDEAFLFRLFKWYLEKRLVQQLLDVRSSSLERFLTQPPQTQEHYDLLWQLYIRNGDFGKAAHVLQNLAESESFHINLEKRLEYLSLAAGNARSEFPNPAIRQELSDFLTDVDEKLEVAQVQVEVARSIAAAEELQRDIQQEMLTALDSRLFTISELFNGFAQPYDMLEVKLLIFYVSDYHDEATIQQVWTDIFHQEPTKAAKLSKIRELGRRFHPSESVFPVDWLISMLEADELKANETAEEAISDSVLDAFLDAGVAFEQLAQAYTNLFNGRIPPWHTKAASEHLVRATTALFERWLRAAQSSTFVLQQSDFPAAELLDQVDRFIQTVPQQDKTLRSRLAVLQKQLGRGF